MLMRRRFGLSRHRPFRYEALEPRCLLAVADSLVITEIMYEPALTPAEEEAELRERDFEFVELQNIGDQPISLDGVELLEGVEFTFGATVLQPQAFVLVVRNLETFEARYGTGLPVAGEYSGTLANGGDQLVLEDSDGTAFMDFEFDNAWYPSTDGEGHSLTIIDPTADRDDWENASAWMPSTNQNGSPGVADPSQGFIAKAVSANVVSSLKIVIEWDAATAPPSQIQEYRVYRDGQLLGSATETSFTDATVSPGNDYSYQVSVVDASSTEFVKTFPVAVRVAAIGGDPSFELGASVPVGGVMDHGLIELSGLVTSKRNPEVLWLHDDGAGNNDVHAVNRRGEYLGVLQLEGASSTDWEDITAGPGPAAGVDYLYIGDIGDNNRDRTSIQVFRVAEPAMSADQTDQTILEANYTVIDLVYSDGESYDAEALFSDPRTGDLYVVTKENNSAQIFRATAAQLNGSTSITMSLVGEVAFDAVSAADISPDGSEIVFRNEDEASLFVRGENQSVAEALAGRGFAVPVVGTPDEPNGEAITFTSNGNGYVTISEGEEVPLYFFGRVGPALPGDANGDGRVDAIDMAAWAQHQTQPDALWSQGDFNGDGQADAADYQIWDANKFTVRPSDIPQSTGRTPRAPLATSGETMFSPTALPVGILREQQRQTVRRRATGIPLPHYGTQPPYLVDAVFAQAAG